MKYGINYTIFYQNIRGIMTMSNEIHSALADNKYNVLTLLETGSVLPSGRDTLYIELTESTNVTAVVS